MNIPWRKKIPEHPSERPSKNENPHIGAGKQFHNDRYMDLAIGRRNWRLAAFILSGCVGVLAISLAWLAAQSRVQPYVTVIDDHFQILSVGPAKKTLEDPELVQRVVQAEVVDFIRNARSISGDPIAQVSLMDEVWTHAADDTRRTLSTYYQKNNPGVAAQAGRRVSVEIESALLRSDRTWDVRWSEVDWDPSGTAKRMDRWEARLQVDIVPPEDSETAIKNPLGLYITGLTWSRLIP